MLGFWCILDQGEQKANIVSTSTVLARIRPDLSSLLGFRQESGVEHLPTRLPAIDRLLGGCPRGRITEIVGPASSGRTSLLHSILGSARARGEYCAIVDATDAFDPETAAASGAVLETMVWVRCGGNLEHAMKSADLLLHSGGFGVVALDLCDAPPQSARRIPISWWHRFRRAVESSDTVFAVLSSEPQAKSCATLAAEAGPGQGHFTGRHPYYLLEAVSYSMASRRPPRPGEARFRAEAREEPYY